jgi:2-polyprenyl-3-methyl-5-hydroxy-6-metoxy-1,4-benzoquinol methylase
MKSMNINLKKTFSYNRSIFLFISLLICFLLNSCQVEIGFQKKKDYINNDSTAIVSTHPSRPFKYGFAYTIEESKKAYNESLIQFDIKKGDVVADIGAASGWQEGIISIFVDSVTFYIQDIDTNYSNTEQLEKVVKYYSNLRTTPQTNKFKHVTGSEQLTNLPDNKFDKIILINTYHEISSPDSIIKDINKKLKRNGKIIIEDAFSNDYKKIRHSGCNIKSKKLSEVILELSNLGFILTNMAEPENSHYNKLTFQKKEYYNTKNDSKSFLNKKSTVQKYITELDKLNDLNVANDSLSTLKIADFLKDNLDTITSVYKSLYYYIDNLSDAWLNEKEILAAVNISKINIILYNEYEGYNFALAYYQFGKGHKLFKKKDYISAINIFKENIKRLPEYSFVYQNLGYAYMKTKQYDLALINYLKSIEINNPNDPDNFNARRMIKKINKHLLKSR